VLRSAALAKRGGQDRERRGRHHRRSDTLEHPCGDQSVLVLRKTGAQGARAEHDHASDEYAPAPQQVGQPPAQEEETTVGQEIAACDPLQVLLREMQGALDRRECDVGDRRIDHIQELDAAQEQQRQHPEPRSQKRRLVYMMRRRISDPALL
jgi:hypothetical protein